VTKLLAQQEQSLQQEVRETDDRFFFNVHKMEAERVKYMLKSYLRTRLFKIERFILCIVEKDQTALLSDGEIAYAWSIYESKKDLFTQ
jgi:GINS complex subunit 4